MRFSAPLALACAVCLVAAGNAQQAPTPAPPPTFRAGVDVVQLDVSVLDRNRRPVRGLTAADFTVLEDGKPQHVVAFQAFDLPDRIIPATPWMREVAPDVATNRVLDGRLVVVVIAGMPGRDYWTSATATRIAETILDQLGPDDLTAVVYTAESDKRQGFTSDRARIRAALTDITRWAPPRLNTKITCAGAVLDELLRVADTLQAEPQRRKTIFFVSAGFRMREPLPNDCVGGAIKDLLRDAQRGNINIYGIDPGRLLAGWQMNEGSGIAPPAPLNVRLEGSDGLRRLSESTGGRAIINDEKDHPEVEIPDVFEENSSYYLLGFRSANPKPDGQFRKLDVRVNRPGVEVRTRSGYFAGNAKPKSSKQPALSPLDESVTGLLPLTETSLRAAAAPFAMPGKPGAVVAVVLGVRQPASDARTTEHLSMLTNAFDLDGQSQAFERQTLDLTVGPNANGELQYEVLSRLALPPGRYDLRIGTQSGTQQRGSVYTYIDVPNFAKDELSLSGLVLEHVPAPAVVPERALADVLPLVPTTTREFAPTDRVTAFVRVYQGGHGTLVTASVAARIVDDRNETMFDQKTPLGAENFSQNRAADYRLDLPLARFATGEYLLTIAAALGKYQARRDVRFTVK